MKSKILDFRNGNSNFIEGNYEKSLMFYNKALENCSENMKPLIEFNISLLKKRLKVKKREVLLDIDAIYKPTFFSLSEANSSIVVSNNKKTIDIIVPVFNALAEVKKCLNSVYFFSDGFNVRVFVVNDYSNFETSIWLKNFCAGKEKFILIENKENQGYTKTVNIGLKATEAEYVITLNSDTCVTPGWLSSLITCAEYSKEIGIVGPLSNAASWQNIPKLKDLNGKFSVNELPPNVTNIDMSSIVKFISNESYPDLPFINGFCFLIKRAVIDKIGYLDEESFPEGYGEENDYCIRASNNGFRLVVADDAYVYHSKSKSFGHDKKSLLSEKGDKVIRRKYTDEFFEKKLKLLKDTSKLDSIRQDVDKVLSSNVKKNNLIVDPLELSILFLLPVGGTGGGIHSIVQEAAAMKNIGIEANIAIRMSNSNSYYNNYKNIQNVNELFLSFNSDKDLENIACNYDVVVATIYSSVKLLSNLYRKNPHFIPAYYIQDYEPYFFDLNSEKYNIANESYELIPESISFAKTNWICNEVNSNHQILVHKVEPSLDHSVYFPRTKRQSRIIKICAMIRFSSPRRAPIRTLNILRAIKNYLDESVEINIFGSPIEHEMFINNDYEFVTNNYGELTREGVAEVLSNSDVFLDMSDYQAFGRTAIEAMACGCVPVITTYGGADEFAVSGFNSILIDSLDEKSTFGIILNLLNNKNLITLLKSNAIYTASQYSVHKAAYSELRLFAKLATIRGYTPKALTTHKVIILPSLLKTSQGSYIPAGSAYVRLLLPYTNNNLNNYRFFIQKNNVLPDPGKAKYFICQRDMSGVDINDFLVWAEEWKKAGSKIIYDIDDNLTDTIGIVERTKRSIEDANKLREKVIKIASTADLVIASTPHLVNVMRRYNDNTIFIPNFLDEEIWWITKDRSKEADAFNENIDDVIRIGYIGTPTHDNDLEIVVEAAKLLEKKYRNRIIIEVIGGYEKSTPKFGKRINLPKKTLYINFVEWLDKRINWDIGIIPLVEDEFNRSKSYLKFLEYSALKLPIVCSDTLTYRDVAKNNVNCILAKNTTQSWYDSIERLILDKNLRKEIANNAYEELITKHTIQKNIELYENVFNFSVSE